MIDSDSFIANSPKHFSAGKRKDNQPRSSGIYFPAPRLSNFFTPVHKPQPQVKHEKHIHHHHHYMDVAVTNSTEDNFIKFGHDEEMEPFYLEEDAYHEDPYYEGGLYCKNCEDDIWNCENNDLSVAEDWEKAPDVDDLSEAEEWEKAADIWEAKVILAEMENREIYE